VLVFCRWNDLPPYDTPLTEVAFTKTEVANHARAHRGLSEKLDRETPSRSEVNAQYLLRSLFWCGFDGLDRFWQRLHLAVLEDRGPGGTFVPHDASRNNAQVCQFFSSNVCAAANPLGSAPMDFFVTNDSGRTLNRFSQDLQIIDMELPLSFIGTSISALAVVAQCVVIVVESPWTGFAVLLLVITLFFVLRVYLRTSRRLRYLDIEMKSPVLSLLMESIDGLATVRAFGWTEWYLRRGLKVLGQAQVPFHLLQTAQVTLNLCLDLLVAMLAIVVVSIAVGTHSTSSGGLGLTLLNVVGLGQSVKIVVHFYTALEITLGAVARIRDFTLQTESENSGREEPPADWPRSGAIQFENVTLSHS